MTFHLRATPKIAVVAHAAYTAVFKDQKTLGLAADGFKVALFAGIGTETSTGPKEKCDRVKAALDNALRNFVITDWAPDVVSVRHAPPWHICETLQIVLVRYIPGILHIPPYEEREWSTLGVDVNGGLPSGSLFDAIKVYASLKIFDIIRPTTLLSGVKKLLAVATRANRLTDIDELGSALIAPLKATIAGYAQLRRSIKAVIDMRRRGRLA